MATSKHCWVIVVLVMCAIVGAAIYIGVDQHKRYNTKLIVNNLTISDIHYNTSSPSGEIPYSCSFLISTLNFFFGGCCIGAVGSSVV